MTPHDIRDSVIDFTEHYAKLTALPTRRLLAWMDQSTHPSSSAATSSSSSASGQPNYVRCSPHSPQSNGKLKRYHRTLNEQAIRPKTPLSLSDVKRVVADFIDHDKARRLHSAIGYNAPNDRLANRHIEIFLAHDKTFENAREMRNVKPLRHQQIVA